MSSLNEKHEKHQKQNNDSKLKRHTILGNIGLGVIALFALLQIYYNEEILTGLILFVSALLMNEYIKVLEKKAGVDKKITRLGLFCYLATALLGIIIVFFNYGL